MRKFSLSFPFLSSLFPPRPYKQTPEIKLLIKCTLAWSIYLQCCLPACFRETLRPLECDFVKATSAAALKHLVLIIIQKHTHSSKVFISMETLFTEITSEETMASGQGSCLTG